MKQEPQEPTASDIGEIRKDRFLESDSRAFTVKRKGKVIHAGGVQEQQDATREQTGAQHPG